VNLSLPSTSTAPAAASSGVLPAAAASSSSASTEGAGAASPFSDVLAAAGTSAQQTDSAPQAAAPGGAETTVGNQAQPAAIQLSEIQSSATNGAANTAPRARNSSPDTVSDSDSNDTEETADETAQDDSQTDTPLTLISLLISACPAAPVAISMEQASAPADPVATSDTEAVPVGFPESPGNSFQESDSATAPASADQAGVAGARVSLTSAFALAASDGTGAADAIAVSPETPSSSGLQGLQDPTLPLDVANVAASDGAADASTKALPLPQTGTPTAAATAARSQLLEATPSATGAMESSGTDSGAIQLPATSADASRSILTADPSVSDILAAPTTRISQDAAASVLEPERPAAGSMQATSATASAGENFASLETASGDPGSSDSSDSSGSSGEDTSLITYNQSLRSQRTAVGIGSATTPSAMQESAKYATRQRSLSSSDSSALKLGASLAAAFSTSSSSAASAAMVHESSTATATAASHAAAAVEAVISAAERATTANHSSVEMKLSFADDTRLSMRVELRGGTVYTTFRTDSTGLREALEGQWQSTAPAELSVGDRVLRVADPVFSSSSGSDLSDTSSGTSTGQQPDSRRSFASENPGETFSFSSLQSEDDSEAQPAGVTSTARPSTSIRLNALA